MQAVLLVQTRGMEGLDCRKCRAQWGEVLLPPSPLTWQQVNFNSMFLSRVLLNSKKIMEGYCEARKVESHQVEHLNSIIVECLLEVLSTSDHLLL